MTEKEPAFVHERIQKHSLTSSSCFRHLSFRQRSLMPKRAFQKKRHLRTNQPALPKKKAQNKQIGTAQN